jgi:hypothetical protein
MSLGGPKALSSNIEAPATILEGAETDVTGYLSFLVADHMVAGESRDT